MQVAAFLFGTPVGVATFFRTLLTDKPDVAIHAGEAGAVVGVYLAFHRQTNKFCVAAGRVAINSPHHMKALPRMARYTSVAATLTASVALKQQIDIQPRLLSRNTVNPKIVISMKL